MIFTHFEDVAAPDLNSAGRKTKVLEGLSNAIQAIVSLPKAQRVLLERTAESKAHFLAHMDQPEVKLRSTQLEMKRICEHFERSIGETEPPKFRPLFNEYAIADVLRREIEAYRRDWSEADIARTVRACRSVENDPNRSFEAFHATCLSALVTDRAMEAWYHPSIA